MAQTIVIEQGDKDLQNVTKITPDTRVNQKANIQYPTAVEPGPGYNAMVEESFTEDEVTFVNPHKIGVETEEESS